MCWRASPRSWRRLRRCSRQMARSDANPHPHPHPPSHNPHLAPPLKSHLSTLASPSPSPSPSPSGEVWLYNDRVSYSLGPDGQTECRACLDKALASHGLAATADTCLRLPRDFDELPSHAYLLRITRAPSA